MHDIIPMHLQVANRLREMIANGAWRMGECIPSRRQLAADFSVHVKTIQRAIAPLIDEGILRPGNRREGTFVASVPNLPATFDPVHVPTRHDAPQNDLMAGYKLGVITGNQWNDHETVQVIDGQIRSPYTPTNWHTTVVHTVEEIFSGAGGSIRTVDFYRDVFSHTEAIERLVYHNVDAIIVIGVHDEFEVREETVKALSKVNIPVLYLTPSPLNDPIPHIFMDQQYSGYLAAQYLLELGFHQLAFYSPFTADWIADRLTGAQHAAARYGVVPTALPTTRVGYHARDWAVEDFYGLVKEDTARLIARGELNLKDGPLGIIAANDDIACPFIEVAQEAGFRAGEHYAIIGFDDSWAARYRNMTSMRPPLTEMGQLATQSIIAVLQGGTMPKQMRTSSTIIRRDSTFAITGALTASLPNTLSAMATR